MGQGGEDDEDQLQSVHPLAADQIRQSSKPDLADDGAARGGDLDGGIGMFGNGARLLGGILPVDDAQHGRHQIDGEDIVRIGEKADAGDDNGAHMVPAKGSFIDFRQGESSTLIGVLDVSIIIVEIMEGGIAARRLVCHGCLVDMAPGPRMHRGCGDGQSVEGAGEVGGGGDGYMQVSCDPGVRGPGLDWRDYVGRCPVVLPLELCIGPANQVSTARVVARLSEQSLAALAKTRSSLRHDDSLPISRDIG